MESLKIGSLRQEKLLLRAGIPCLFLLIFLPLGLASAFNASLPWIAYVRLTLACGLGALVSYLLSRRLHGFRFEMDAHQFQVVSGLIRKRYPISVLSGPVRLSDSWIPLLSFRVGRVRHWYSVRNLSAQERATVLLQFSVAAASNELPPACETVHAERCEDRVDEAFQAAENERVQ